MSNFAKLLGAIEGNESAIGIAKDLESSMNELTAKINKLELKNEELLSDIGKTRDKFRTVKDKLGVEDLTEEESLAKALSSKPDEKTQSELNNLKAQLEKSVLEKTEIENSYKQKMGNLVLKTELNKTGLAQRASSPETYALLESLVLDGANYAEDGQIVFKNPDGSTAYVDGRPMGLEDKVNGLVNNQAYAGLFKPQGQGGSGASNNTSGGSKPFAEMSEGERVALYNKNPDEFRRLAGTA